MFCVFIVFIKIQLEDTVNLYEFHIEYVLLSFTFHKSMVGYTFYPTALRGTVFTHGVRMGGRVAGKVCPG